VTSWKQTFFNGIDLDNYPKSSFQFGAPASAQELSQLANISSIGIPEDLEKLLSEFNGVSRKYGDASEPVLFNTNEMVEAVQFYRYWDVPTDHLIDWSRNVFYLTQCNGFASMFGLVVCDLGTFNAGEFIKFDHDHIESAVTPEDLFCRCADDLAGLIDIVTIAYC